MSDVSADVLAEGWVVPEDIAALSVFSMNPKHLAKEKTDSAAISSIYIMFQIYSVEHFYGLGGESLRETFTICIYASLTARSLSTLVTPQCNPTMCNRTSCSQVHELP